MAEGWPPPIYILLVHHGETGELWLSERTLGQENVNGTPHGMVFPTGQVLGS